MEVIALVLPLVGAVGIWETQFPLSWSELIHFQHIKARSSYINEGKQMGRFFGGGGGVDPVDWRAVIVGFHASLAEKAYFLELGQFCFVFKNSWWYYWSDDGYECLSKSVGAME